MCTPVSAASQSVHACVLADGGDAGAAHIAAHNIYIWDRGAGALDKILEGPKEPLVDVDVSRGLTQRRARGC
jgi:hypothetical protein